MALRPESILPQDRYRNRHGPLGAEPLPSSGTLMGLSENVERLQPSATIAVSSLAKRLRSQGRDIVDLSAGEPDFDTPDWISRAGIEGIRAGGTRYTPAPGLPELRKAIAGRLSRESGREIPWEGIVVSVGAKQALFNACFCLFGPGDEVLIASPHWTSYPEIVKLARAEPVPVSGAEERDFRLGPEELEAASTKRTRGLILCSPSNPTGTVYSEEELRAVAEWARERDLWLLSDEIYRLIYYPEDRRAAPGLLDLPPGSLGRHVLVDGASKSYAMTGWRIGFASTDPELASSLTALQSHTTSNAATPSQLAALAAFGDDERARESVAAMVAAFRRRRDLVTGLMDELLPELPYVRPRGAFYLFFRVDGVFNDEIRNSSELCTRLLEEAGVALVPGVAFGDDRFVRMSFATSDDVLEDGVRRMAEMVRAVPAGAD